MTDIAREVYDRLDGMGIAYQTVRHAPARTIRDCAQADRMLGALTVKNYFLTTKNRKGVYLCLVRPQARFRSADISKQLGSSRLSFGPEDMLEALLRVHPGSVSPMGLLFDEERRVELVVDAGLRSATRLAFHPCDNRQTLAMSGEDFFSRFLPALGREPRWVEIHGFEEVDAPCGGE